MKYYKIPMTERIIKVDGISLFEKLQEHYPDLHNREKGRIELQYGENTSGIVTPNLKEVVGEYNRKTDNLYRIYGVPKYIIAIGKNEELREYVTGKTLEQMGQGYIALGREVSCKEALEYLNNTENYTNVINKMLIQEDSKSLKKTLIQRAIKVIASKKYN